MPFRLFLSLSFSSYERARARTSRSRFGARERLRGRPAEIHQRISRFIELLYLVSDRSGAICKPSEIRVTGIAVKSVES